MRASRDCRSNHKAQSIFFPLSLSISLSHSHPPSCVGSRQIFRWLRSPPLIWQIHRKIGYLDQGLLVRDAAKLRKHYFSTKGWRLDILSVLPTDFLYFWWEPSKCHIKVPCPVIVRLNRLFRLPRMWEWFERTETATGYPNAFRICKVSIIFIRTLHLILGFFHIIGPMQKRSRQQQKKIEPDRATHFNITFAKILIVCEWFFSILLSACDRLCSRY